MKKVENHILTVFEFNKAGCRIKLSCFGCRELIKTKSILPDHIKGQIEYKGQFIPIVDLGRQFYDCGSKVDHDSCVIIFKHRFDHRKLYSAFLVTNFEKVLEMTLWDMKDLAAISSDKSMLVILDCIEDMDDYTEKALWKNHLLMSYLNQKSSDEPILAC